jgi:glutamate:Na+ symporter, ESS family
MIDTISSYIQSLTSPWFASVAATQVTAVVVLVGVIVTGFLVVRAPLIRRMYLPASVAAGLILLLLSPQLIGKIAPEWSFEPAMYQAWSAMPVLLINVVFAGLFLARPLVSLKEIWRLAAPQAAYGQMIAWGFYMVGGLVTLFVLIPFFQASPLSAALIEISFEGGHGTAAGMIPVFNELDFHEGQEMSVALATTSLLSALIAGMILVQWGRRKKLFEHSGPLRAAQNMIYHRRIVHELREQGIGLREEVTIARLLGHCILLAAGVGIGWVIHQGLLQIEHMTWGQDGVKIFGYMPLFTFCMFGGMIAQAIWTRLGFATSRPIVELLCAAALGILVTTAIGTMSLEFIGSNGWTYVILAVTGVVWVVGCFLLLARRMFARNWFAYAITSTGQSLGTTATGLLFAQIVDPKQKTGAVESFGYKQLLFEPLMGGGFVTALSMPLIVLLGLPLFTTICAVICFGWMIVGLLVFGRQR